jgi:acetyl-CoA acetyltransferase
MPSHAVITGVFDTAVGKVEGSTSLGLQAEAAMGAVADAGLSLNEIDGVLCGYSLTEPHLMLSSVVSEFLGIKPSYSTAVQAGGATACAQVMHAAILIETGICQHVLVVCGDNRLSGMSRDQAVAALSEVGHAEFERPYGISIPSAYALVAQRYMHEYGVTPEHLAGVAVAHRKHAMRNPKAQMRKPLTLEDVANSRVISSPLRLFDCCQISDGGAAVVVSTANAAPDTRKHGIDILGMGQMNTHEHIVAAPSLTEFGCKQSSSQALHRAGVQLTDIDLLEIYDSFTITLLVELESIGFFERGEAGPAILDGALDLDGRLPCNTHGGLLSYAHSGAAGGMFHVVEAVRQLRGEADGRQVTDPELALIHGDGGVLSAHCSLVFGRH